MINRTIRTIFSNIGLSLFVLVSTWILIQTFPTKEPLSQAIRVFWGGSAYVAMAVNMLLASRLPLTESIFGGLDAAIKQHRQLGILAMIGALMHYWSPPIFSDENCIGACAVFLAPSLVVGQAALILLTIFGLISTLRRFKFKSWQLPYDIWKLTHWTMLIVFAAATIHLMLMPKMPFGYIVFAQFLGALGVMCGIFYGVGYFLRLKRSYKYKVVSMKTQGDISIIDLEPIGRMLTHRAGQFAFIQFDAPNLLEAHPFSISSGEADLNLQFCIKAVGDFTKQVPSIVECGTVAIVEGPYGRFGRQRRNQENWIAAGVGITPFLSIAKTLVSNGEQENARINLTHIVRNEEDQFQYEFLTKTSRNLPHFEFISHVSSQDGRWLTPNKIEGSTLYCGPTALKTHLKRTAHKFESEEFVFN